MSGFIQTGVLHMLSLTFQLPVKFWGMWYLSLKNENLEKVLVYYTYQKN